MNKNFERELLRQLSLINFDRSLPLLEQKELKSWEKSDRLGSQGEFQPEIVKPQSNPTIYSAELIYKELKTQIDSYGTNDDTVIKLLKNITSETYPKILDYVMEKENQVSLMDWIMTDYVSVSERNAEGGNPNIWSTGGLGSKISWWLNDETVVKISKILKKFDYLNTGEGEYNIVESGEVDLYSDSQQGVATTKELSEIAHTMLPILAVATALFTGGISGLLIGGAIELTDSAIYEFVDHDHYAAGLTLIFAIAGPLDNVLAPLVKRYGKRILVKLMKKQALSAAEETTIRYVSRNKQRLARLTYLGLARKLIKDFILKTSDASKIVRFIFWLTKKGYLTAKFTAKYGLIFGGPFLTWDAIAEKLGLCNSMELSPLKQTDYKILQLIGTAGDYIQPYTKGCKTDKGDKIFKEADKTLLKTKGRIKEVLNAGIKTNMTFSTKYSKYKMYEVILIQYLLYYYGFSYTIPNQKNIDKEVEKGVKFSKEKCLAMMSGSMDMYKMSQHPECNQYFNPDKKINKETEKLLNTKPSNTGVNNSYGKNIPFNWGYYDKQTEDMVKEFQKKYGLSVDGKVGPNTFIKMKSLIDGLGDKDIPDYVKLSWTEKEVEKLRGDVQKLIEQDSLKSDGSENVTKEEVERMIQQQKDSIVESIDRANENFTYDEDDIFVIKKETDKP